MRARSPAPPARRGDILGDYPQAVGPAADALYATATATAISPEARDWVRNFLATQHNVRF